MNSTAGTERRRFTQIQLVMGSYETNIKSSSTYGRTFKNVIQMINL